MRTLKLGHSGLEVSAVCLGCLTYAPKEASGYTWSLDEAESRPFIRQALELGINFYDTANSYLNGASEEILGRGLLARPWQQPTDSVRHGHDRFAKQLYSATEEADRRVVEAVTAVAAERGVSQAQVALAWLYLHKSVVAPVIGATKFSHLDDTVAASDLVLSTEEIARLEAPYIPHNVVEHN